MSISRLMRTVLALTTVLAITLVVTTPTSALPIEPDYTDPLWEPANGLPIYSVGNRAAEAVGPSGPTTDLSQSSLYGLGVTSTIHPDAGIGAGETLELEFWNGPLTIYGFIVNFYVPGVGEYSINGGAKQQFAGSGRAIVSFTDPEAVLYMHLGVPVGGLSSFSIEAVQDTPPVPVPEPGSMILLGAGLTGIAFARKRRVGSRPSLQ